MHIYGILPLAKHRYVIQLNFQLVQTQSKQQNPILTMLKFQKTVNIILIQLLNADDSINKV